MTEQERQPTAPVVQFLQLIGLWVAGTFVVGAVLAVFIIWIVWGKDTLLDITQMTHTTTPGFIGAFRVLVALSSSLFGFLVPALLFNYWISRDPNDNIRLGSHTPVILLLLAAVLMLSFLPTIDITGYVNQKMTFPSQFSGLYKWIKDRENEGAMQVKILLNMKTPVDLAISLTLVALFPAVCEEFFFRGCMQPIFKRSTQNTHLAVWITAFIFSSMHLEFFGFVPRLLLGAALGYLFAWSGTIWPSVMVHFVNNGFSVVGLYLYQHKYFKTDPDNGQPVFSQAWIYVVSLLLSIGLMYLFHKITIDKQLLADGEELD